MISRPDPFDYLTGRLSARPLPPGISLPGQGGKFTTDGHVQRWPGNTFVCHVTRPSAAFDALRSVQECIMRSEFSALFAHLPAPSFHMTVFQGISPGERAPGTWPEGLPDDTSPDDVDSALAERTKDLRLPAFEIAATGLWAMHGVTVAGRTPEAEATLRAARDTLRDATGLRPPGFERYVFHITLCYLKQWLTDGTARDVLALNDEIYAKHADALSEIPLDPCAFCRFESMHAFTPVQTLA